MKPLNRETINTILDLADGDSNVLIELLISFLKDAKELSEEINHAVTNLDWNQLQFKVHTLKGLSGTMGAKPLFEICKMLNDDLKKGNTQSANSLAISLSVEYNDLEEYIKSNYKI